MKCEAPGAVPKIAFAKFTDVSTRDKFLREQKSLGEFDGMWASKSKGPLERMLDKRMNKIKRAIIEITSCQADSVVIDRSESIIYTVESNSGSLQQVASVSTEDGSVTWVDGVSAAVRERASALYGSE